MTVDKLTALQPRQYITLYKRNADCKAELIRQATKAYQLSSKPRSEGRDGGAPFIKEPPVLWDPAADAPLMYVPTSRRSSACIC